MDLLLILPKFLTFKIVDFDVNMLYWTGLKKKPDSLWTQIISKSVATLGVLSFKSPPPGLLHASRAWVPLALRPQKNQLPRNTSYSRNLQFDSNESLLLHTYICIYICVWAFALPRIYPQNISCFIPKFFTRLFLSLTIQKRDFV